MLSTTIDRYGQKPKEGRCAAITQLFSRLPEDRQQQVLDAAMGVFARHGYHKSSTQQIADAAGMSKGMVFHYFGSKQALYEVLCGITADFFTEWGERLQADMRQMDYITRYSWLARRKLEAYVAQPAMFAFLTMLITQPENQLISDKTRALCSRFDALRAGALDDMAHSGNTDRFREDLPPDNIRSYVTYIIEGYMQTVMMSLKNEPLDSLQHSPTWAAFDALLTDLETLFYKQ